MVSCLAYQAKSKGIQVLPVIASIVDGFRVSKDHPVAPIFNHLIGAVPLAKSLGLPAEVQIGDQIMLLVDPTAKYTPLGFLPSGYKDRNLLVCTKEGAQWIEVPEKALEDSSLTLNLNGLLDAQYTLGGTLELIERGDAHFLRTLNKSGNIRNLEWSVRQLVDMPGTVELTLVSRHLDDNQNLNLIYQLKWPSFLQRDAGGLRLPGTITPRAKGNLQHPGSERQFPIAFDQLPDRTWNLSIRSKTPLHPGTDKAQWEGDYHRFAWEAEGGTNLKVRFEFSRKFAYFPIDKTSAGLAYWDGYSKAFNDFSLNGTLFQIQ